jgi:serine protease Do
MGVAKAAVFICLGTWLGTASLTGQTTREVVNGWSGSYLGVMVQEINNDRAKALKLPEEAGVEITRVESGSPAEKAGLKTGDVVSLYNGQRVEGMEEFSRLVRETPAGREVKLSIFREGAAQTLTAKIGSRHAAGVFGAVVQPVEPFSLHIPDIPRSFMSWRSSALGVEVETLEGQLAQFFGVKDGVLVRSVGKDTPADKAGIKVGDVITRVGDSKVTTPSDISTRIRSAHGSAIPVVLMRDHKEITVNVTLDQDGRSEDHWWQNSGSGLRFRTIDLPDTLR